MSAPRAGRRMATARPPRFDAGVVLAVVLAVLAVAAVLVASSGRAPDQHAAQASGVPVDHALHGCPRFAAPRGTSTTAVTGAAPVPGLGERGSVRYGAPGDAPSSWTEADLGRGELLRIEAGAGDPQALAVEATGRLAAGLFTFEVDAADSSTAVTDCPSPRAQWWFTGAGATLDHTSELVLTNLDTGPAVVDVQVLGPDGEVETVGTRGITVAPGERSTLSLTDVAPQGEELAVSVVASRGRVVAAVSDSFTPGTAAATGTDWIPAQSSPSRVLRLAGLPAKADSHTLIVANPSQLEALVDVRVSSGTGSFTPTDDAQVRVPPGTVVATDLSGTIGRDASAVTLRSTVPVTGSVRSVAAGDTSYAGSVRPLTAPAVAPVPGGARATVQVTAVATDEPATATVASYARDGSRTGSTTVEVPGGATLTTSPEKKADYVVVTARGGRLVGAVTYRGEGLAAMPLRPLALRVDEPVVLPALG
ncbi:MAG TPA: DUF5719 family protein [Nocardioidaceae bacterium]|nr:DUF5719 family protein [Nocardioidaceae bacterium]